MSTAEREGRAMRATGTAFEIEKLKSILSCDIESGEFVWLKRVSRMVSAGDKAGCVCANGYVYIGINRKRYLAHRLVWLFANGAFPIGYVDHINGIKLDNQISNLRLATMSQNLANTGLKSTNTSGFKGVSWNKNAHKWDARCNVDGKRNFLGLHTTAEAAHEAYQTFARKTCGEFFRETT